MTGGSSLCIKGRYLPLNGAHVPHEQFKFRCPLPHVAGSPDRKVLSGSLTSVRPSDPPRFAACQTLQARLEPDGSPLFPCIPLAACQRYKPRRQLRTLANSRPEFLPSPLEDWLGHLKFRFRGYLVVYCRSGLQPPCLRFAMAVAGHHARLGSRLPAKLYRSLHLSRLDYKSFQRATSSMIWRITGLRESSFSATNARSIRSPPAQRTQMRPPRSAFVKSRPCWK
jgi:hypothetical protein